MNQETDIQAGDRYEVLFRLASRHERLEPVRDQAGRIWASESDRGWLIAALIRRLGRIDADLDESICEFLADQLSNEFDLGNTGDEILAEIASMLPGYVLQLDASAWNGPSALWLTLCKLIQFDMDLPRGNEFRVSFEPSDLRLFDIVSKTIGEPWNPERDQVVLRESAQKDQSWLIALREAMLLDAAVVGAEEGEDPWHWVDEFDIRQALKEKSGLQISKLLSFADAQTGRPVYGEIHQTPDALTWRFRFSVGLGTQRTYEFILNDRRVGRVSLQGESGGGVVIRSAHGLLTPLATELPDGRLELRAAAAHEKSDLQSEVKLRPRFTARLRSVIEGVELEIIWE